MSISFQRAIFSDIDIDYIYLPEMLVAQNAHMEPDLTDVSLGDEIEIWSADGRDYRGTQVATEDDARQFRKLVSAEICKRLYALPIPAMLAALTDNELEALLIHRGLNT